jgi:dTDP-glucose 4,6-dehydratase
MKTYLVTGGAGFIGANFVKYLLKTYHEDVNIVILDALTYAGNLLSIKEEIELPNVTFIKGNICDKELVDDIMATHDPDFVVNFAAESHVDRSITNPRLFLETNVLGTQNMLDCARRSWSLPEGGFKPGKKYLQVSTDEVYGSLTRDFESAQPLELSPEVVKMLCNDRPDDKLKTYGKGFFTEQTPISPRSPYSASKASADMLVQAYHHTYGLPINITRCSNNYGPYQFPEKLIPLVINNIEHRRALPVYGKGLNVRDWLYVGDHVAAIDRVLNCGIVGEVYNIGGFNEEQNIDIVHHIIDSIVNIKGGDKAEIEGLITYVTDRLGHDMRYAIDSSHIARELHWSPAISFTQGIRMTVKWYLDNQQWIDSCTSGEYEKYYEQMYSNR